MSHRTIRIIVYAQDEEKALEDAESVLEGMVGERAPFSYFSMFGPEDNLPAIVTAGSPEGIDLIQKGMEATKREFMHHLKNIREILTRNRNAALWTEESHDNLRFECNQLGQYKGGNVLLYDDDGEGIHTPEDLRDVLSKCKCLFEDRGKENPYKDDTIYVVPADVHF